MARSMAELVTGTLNSKRHACHTEHMACTSGHSTRKFWMTHVFKTRLLSTLATVINGAHRGLVRGVAAQHSSLNLIPGYSSKDLLPEALQLILAQQEAHGVGNGGQWNECAASC